MNIRQRTEALEEENLSIYASLSNNTRGRKIEEAKCNLRTEYQRDRDRILHSKSFRRLKHKTQVFIAPEGDHYRTRLTHTLEVAQIARTIARALRLNEDLVEAIALGHDLGHTPFGHTGERVLNKLNPRGFKHNLQSLRIIDFLERRENDKTLNLTEEVREGIMQHSGLNKSRTLEGQVVAIADRIAYINHDIDDAIRAGVISLEDLPKDPIDILGRDHGIRIDRMIEDLVINSMDSHKIEMSQEIGDKVEELREFMFDNVYLDSRAKSEEAKAEYIIEELYNYYLENERKLPSEYYKTYKEDQENLEDVICDYIAGMTDRYVLAVFSDIFLPKAWNKKD